MIQLRKATEADFEAVCILLSQLWPGKPSAPDCLRSVYLKVISDPRRHYYCADDNGHLVGLGSLTFKDNLWQEGEIAIVDELVVLEARRGQGIGSILMQHLIALAQERGCRRIELDSGLHRIAAHQFYEHLGFQKRAYFFSRPLP